MLHSNSIAEYLEYLLRRRNKLTDLIIKFSLHETHETDWSNFLIGSQDGQRNFQLKPLFILRKAHTPSYSGSCRFGLLTPSYIHPLTHRNLSDLNTDLNTDTKYGSWNTLLRDATYGSGQQACFLFGIISYLPSVNPVESMK